MSFSLQKRADPFFVRYNWCMRVSLNLIFIAGIFATLLLAACAQVEPTATPAPAVTGIIGPKSLPGLKTATFGPDAELLVYARTRRSEYLELPGWAAVPPSGRLNPPVTITEAWSLVDGTGLVSRAHGIVSTPDGGVIQESFYETGGPLVTFTSEGTESYRPPGDILRVILDRGQDIESAILDPDWIEVSDSTTGGIRVFELHRAPTEFITIGTILVAGYDATGAIVQTTITEAESGMLIERMTIEVFDVSVSSGLDPKIWEAVAEW